MSTCRCGRGFSLVELMIAIVVLAAATVGVLTVFSNTARGSAEALISKQALAVAEAMLEEIQLTAFSNPTGGHTTPLDQDNRQNFDDVSDYAGFVTTGVHTITASSGSPITGLEGYDVSVSVADTTDLSGIASTDAKRITVTVTHAASGRSVVLAGYKVNYP